MKTGEPASSTCVFKMAVVKVELNPDRQRGEFNHRGIILHTTTLKRGEEATVT